MNPRSRALLAAHGIIVRDEPATQPQPRDSQGRYVSHESQEYPGYTVEEVERARIQVGMERSGGAGGGYQTVPVRRKTKEEIELEHAHELANRLLFPTHGGHLG